MKKIDRIKQVFEHLTIIGNKEPINGKTRYLCECDCEEKVQCVVFADNLLSKRTTRCPQCAEVSRKVPDDLGAIILRRQEKSPMLVALGHIKAGAFDNKRGHCVCVCRWCGRLTAALPSDLRLGRKKHCGCRTSSSRSRSKPKSDAYRKTRRCWLDMKARCDNPKHKEYPRYGGRGVTYDPAWKNFEVFLGQMGEKPDGLSIDRLNFNGHYTKSNCRWGTDEDQANNRRPAGSGSFPRVPDPVRREAEPFVPYVAIPYGSDGITI